MKRGLPHSLERRPAGAPDARREAALRRAAAGAAQRYRRLPHVLAVAAGQKYRGGEPTGELAVQFFVDRKLARPRVRIPRWVFARRRDGRVDRSRCFVTDVVEVGRLEFACGGGSQVAALGERGTITLIFRNRAAGAPEWCLLTCSHVAGDLRESPPVDDELASDDCTSADPFARVVKNEVGARGAIAYDVALARLTDAAVGQLGGPGLRRIDGRVEGSGQRLRGFLPRAEIGPSLEVAWVGAGSGLVRSRVTTFELSADVVLDGRLLRVPHLFTLASPARAGDSGGIVHRGEQAVGIVVARSPSGFCWFQPLEGALRHLASLEPAAPLDCFS
jgi:hypothetical protein